MPYLTEIGTLTADKYTIQNELPFCDTWEEILQLFELKKPATQSAKIAFERAMNRERKAQQQPTPPPVPYNQSLEAILAAAIAPHVKPQAAQIDEGKVIELITKHAKPYTAETRIFINNEAKTAVS